MKEAMKEILVVQETNIYTCREQHINIRVADVRLCEKKKKTVMIPAIFVKKKLRQKCSENAAARENTNLNGHDTPTPY